MLESINNIVFLLWKHDLKKYIYFPDSERNKKVLNYLPCSIYFFSGASFCGWAICCVLRKSFFIRLDSQLLKL